MASFYAGNGGDGALSITSSRTEDTTRGVSNINATANSGQKDVTLASAASFSAGEWVLLIQMSGTGAGNYEFAKIASKASNTLTMVSNLTNTYQNTNAQCLRMGQYSSVTVGSGGTWTSSAWGGTTGGVLAAMISGNLTVDSGRTITMDGKGFSGGGGTQFDFAGSGQGPGGGTGADGRFSGSAGGGGGGHATAGGTGSGVAGAPNSSGGGTYGVATLVTAQMGSGGGGGSKAGVGGTNGSGAAGGGIIILVVGGTITVNGNIYARGNTGEDGTDNCDGGGGSGGSIRLLCNSLTLGSSLVSAAGGSGGGAGGGGGNGRVATVTAASVSGTTSPTLDTSSTDTVTTNDPYAVAVNYKRIIITS